MAFCPAVLNPDPEPWFVRELKTIDPDLRVVWGFSRYLDNRWVIERKIPKDRYNAMYHTILHSGEPRFIERPIYDRNQPIYEHMQDEDGQWYEIVMGYTQIGLQNYDLAPEWEWIKTIQANGEYRPLGPSVLLELKREYAWNRNHMYSRERYEADERLKDEKLEKEQKDKRMELWMEAYDQALLEAGQRVTAKPLALTE